MNILHGFSGLVFSVPLPDAVAEILRCMVYFQGCPAWWEPFNPLF